jgi:hypothetical protein
MIWDKLQCLERRLWLVWFEIKRAFQLMVQSSQFDGVAFDPFSLQKDGLASAEVDVG